MTGPGRPAGARNKMLANYLRTSQVADIFHCSPKTVSRWAKEGKLPFIRTLGGHRRYPEAEILALVEANMVRVEGAQQ